MLVLRGRLLAVIVIAAIADRPQIRGPRQPGRSFNFAAGVEACAADAKASVETDSTRWLVRGLRSRSVSIFDKYFRDRYLALVVDLNQSLPLPSACKTLRATVGRWAGFFDAFQTKGYGK